MEVTHDILVGTAKSWGLFYFIGFSICVVIYTFLPSNRERFKSAESEIFHEEDGPWK